MDYPIDFEQYAIEEIIDIVRFLNLLEQYDATPKQVDVSLLKKSYAKYQSILNNLSEEKRIDKAFESQTGIPIYKTMKKINTA